MFTDKNLHLAQELLGAIKFFSDKGWTPATSTNYSVRSEDPQKFIISRSGVDKSQFTLEDLILIDSSKNVLSPFNLPGNNPSAETELHLAIYQKYPEINCVLHTHSILGTVLSHAAVQEGLIRFEKLELLKAFEGNNTHEVEEFVPVVPNSQLMDEILRPLEAYLTEGKPRSHGFLIAGHGLYTWGKDIATAKRHIEAFEFLFECEHVLRRMK